MQVVPATFPAGCREVSALTGGHHQAGLFRASIPRFNSSLPAQFPAMLIKIAGKCDIAIRTSNPNALSSRFSDGRMLLPAERARLQYFLFHDLALQFD
jgi:hypothetical protein